jgi:hypothetical protein
MRNDEFEEILDEIGGLDADDPVHAHGVITAALDKKGEMTATQQKILVERCEEVLDDYWELPLGSLSRLLNLSVS